MSNIGNRIDLSGVGTTSFGDDGSSSSAGLGSANQSAVNPGIQGVSSLTPTQVNFSPRQIADARIGTTTPAADGGNANVLQQVLAILKQVMDMVLGNGQQQQAAAPSSLAAQGSGTPAAPADSASGDSPAAPADSASGDSSVGAGSADQAQSATQPAAPAASTAIQDAGNSGQAQGLHLPKELEPYRADIQDASKATGMPGNVIAGMIWAESRGKLDAATTNVNGKADSGLMQVNADTFKGLQKENPALLGNASVNNAHDNIMAGALYLRDQHQAFGDMGAALRAYNSGPDKVNKANLSETGGVGGATYPSDVLNFSQIIGSGKGQLPA